MLFDFLAKYKNEIIQLCRNKVLANSEAKPTSSKLDKGLPIFYDELIEVLKRTASPSKGPFIKQMITSGAAAHGKESLRLGYTISQVVHAYGAVCQSITEFVQTKSFKIESAEFHDLNLALDCAIAEAVTEFEKVQSENVSGGEGERLGFLMHEMGNALAAASTAHSMIQEGRVGIVGNTSDVLSKSHERMWQLIRSAGAEIRLRGHAEVERTQIRLIDVISEVEANAKVMGREKDIRFKLDVDPSLQFTADRHLVYSALSNLMNNALKFTHEHGNVTVRSKESGGRILIEVEDECGGLPKGKTEELFKSFTQKGSDKTGMGLGLPLSRQAIEANQGKLTARDIPGKGCVFTIDLPKDSKDEIPVKKAA